MTPPTVTYLPVFNDNPDNPARCEVKTGRIQINRLIYDLLPDYQKEFVLEHEKGHYYGQSYNEVVADRYALDRLKLRKPNSLWNYVRSVRAISHEDPVRCYAAEQGALQVAADKGSDEARQLLNAYRSSGRYACADGQATTCIDLPIEARLNPMYLALTATLAVAFCLILSTIKNHSL